ncbi:hypothetical protein PAAG_11265 [Paracoccidioides lutzii Pb01]|uniref:Major facilitator superfamily (MFS) profile domain-containing protein n=1 Tax=Paracoccidioides lutzii (strain ATCC MYA-826 / Pb01) TaxID=502779 RepID=A0A0A2V6A0_PARBA|nr:hypothetical protein PAAG_11265 [Paracoccidioides lutzii Pb01]KGQ01877.1 hypothetical protein PAAG_11265 [Paracoccidioides lutzii Pb01]
MISRSTFLLLFLSTSLTSLVSASSHTSFCKCTCFSNSTIIQLGLPDSKSFSAIHSRLLLFPRDEEDKHDPAKGDKKNRPLNCNDCNRRFCLDYNLPKCKGAKEEDVVTTCFQRDSNKDKAVVFIFIIATASLLVWAAIKPCAEKWISVRLFPSYVMATGKSAPISRVGFMKYIPSLPVFVPPPFCFHPIRSNRSVKNMKLTHPQRPNPRTSTTANNRESPDESFPTIQLFILVAICRLAEPIALTSIFPYAWIMVKDFHMGEEKNASLYSGILISAFALAESLTGIYWGGLSDRVGRKPVLLFGCVGTMLSLLIVGFSTSFWVALLGRVVGGVLNGNIGVVQTMVGELVKKPEHEPRAYAVMPFVWSIGTIIGPAIGGYFARPADSFPSVFSPTGIFGTLPYLLPNLICSTLQLISIFAGYFFLGETHPDLRRGGEAVRHTDDEGELGASLAAVAIGASTAHGSADLRATSYGTFNDVELHKDEEWDVESNGKAFESCAHDQAKVFTYRVTMLVIALGIFTYHSMTYDHLLPIFLQDKGTGTANTTAKSIFNIPSGLGLSVQAVGLIMAVNGVIALLIQAIVFPLLAEWLDVWKLFVLVTVLHPVAYFIVPFLAFLPRNLFFTGIYTCLTIRNFFSILDYPVLLILIKQTCPSHSVLGKINGLAASAGAACRTLAPPIAGYLYSIGSKVGFTGLAWWASAIVAAVGACQLYFIQEKKRTPLTVSPTDISLHPRHTAEEEPLANDVHVTVHDRV